jgi:hypothetical protein
MVMGPMEAFAARLAELEAALGIEPRAMEERRRGKGRLGPGGRMLQGMLRRKELDRAEEDALGYALEAEEAGNVRLAQEWLDYLARSIKARKMVGTGG